ncbi:hypothetical protein HPB50_025037 [Hyalomma asiaticum]|uniref:Uncharacterized protein n=1 Tax=Hyalomma asiaticum TaxID=266040 RepID=A0ACB7TN05_HYAAI|nr:hypothetical protein HPB50_025037 [Hyalomma asiaticum]
MKTAKATKLTCWEQYISAALGSKFAQQLSPTDLRTLGFCVPPVCQRRRQMTSQTEKLCQEVINPTGNGVIESDETFLECALCEQDVPVTGEMADAEIIQTATNGGNGGDDGDDEPPREMPTSAEMRKLLYLLQNKVKCSIGKDRLMRCVKQLEDAFLGPSTTAKQTSIRQFLSAK